MVESRCGLKCSECAYRVPFNCGGCVQTNGHPFYGECKVAQCCQNKGHQHCGKCSDLPCETLYYFSFLDKAHGDNPPGLRIEQVKAWAREEEAV